MKKRLLQLFIFLFLASTSHAYYQAEQGRWLNRDPIEEQGGLNLYSFTQNTPINYCDFLGNKSCPTLGELRWSKIKKGERKGCFTKVSLNLFNVEPFVTIPLVGFRDPISWSQPGPGVNTYLVSAEIHKTYKIYRRLSTKQEECQCVKGKLKWKKDGKQAFYYQTTLQPVNGKVYLRDQIVALDIGTDFGYAESQSNRIRATWEGIVKDYRICPKLRYDHWYYH